MVESVNGGQHTFTMEIAKFAQCKESLDAMGQ